MSIEDEIVDGVQRGMLWPMLPRARRVTIRRAMFVGEALQEMLESPEGDEEWEERVGKLRADLELFVTSKKIDPKYLFLLYPSRDCVWEIRSVRDAPSVRVLGLFAQKNVFIATNHALRSDLGGWQSRAWKKVKRAALAAWRVLFHTYLPVGGANIRTFVTGAISGDYYQDRN